MSKGILAVLLLAASVFGSLLGWDGLVAADGRDRKEVVVGSRVTFGYYPTDSDGKVLEPLEWQVLEVQQGKVLLFSTHVVAARAYHETRETVSWQEADLRQWLNREFFQRAFGEREQAAVLATKIKDERADGEKEFSDKVSLLNLTELIHYLPEAGERVNTPTAWAKTGGVYTNEHGEAAFWLRSLVHEGQVKDYISSYGTPGNRAHYADELVIGVRPVIWVEKSALIEGGASK